MNAKEIACLAARYADAKKAQDIKLIDLGGLSSLCDYILLATATSKPHLEAIEEEISTKLKQEGIYKTNRDGADSQMWRVSDYGSFLVHIMTADAREFYALDKIFSFGKTVDFTAKPKKATAKKAPAAKAAAKKSAASKSAAKKSAAKTTLKKASGKKSSAKKAASVKKTAQKTAATKSAVKKTTAKKSTVKKITKK